MWVGGGGVQPKTRIFLDEESLITVIYKQKKGNFFEILNLVFSIIKSFVYFLQLIYLYDKKSFPPKYFQYFTDWKLWDGSLSPYNKWLDQLASKYILWTMLSNITKIKNWWYWFSQVFKNASIFAYATLVQHYLAYTKLTQ